MTTDRKPRLSHRQALKLAGLLPMEYRPTELARQIGCHRSTIYECYVPNGAPHRRDEHGHLWIVGTEFAVWAGANPVYCDGVAGCPVCGSAEGETCKPTCTVRLAKEWLG